MIWFERLWRRRKLEDELKKVLRFHIDQRAAALIARGDGPEEARRRARLAQELSAGVPRGFGSACRGALCRPAVAFV